MAGKNKPVKIRWDDYKRTGLYLIKDEKVIDLTIEKINELARSYWDDPKKLPPDVKKAVQFQRCKFCYLKDDASICDAIRPLLPLTLKENLGEYISYEEVIAIFRGKQEDIYSMAKTEMQRALQFISILALIYFCQKAKDFQKYFYGVMPFMIPKEVAKRMYLNLYWHNKGDGALIDKTISEFKNIILLTSQNQVARLNLLIESDALKNAYANAQIIGELLSMNMEKTTGESLQEAEKLREV